MKIKTKPNEPKRKKVKHGIDINYCDNLKEVCDFFDGYDLSKVNISIEGDDYYGAGADVFTFRDETDEEFEVRHSKWRKKIVEYNEWFAENEALIKAYQEAKKISSEEKKLKKKKEIEDRITSLKKELDKIK